VTGLPWIRLNTAFPSDPRLLSLVAERDGYRAGLASVAAMAWSGAAGTNGYVPQVALPFIHARQAEAERLVRHGFWIPDAGGWQIPNWADEQQSGEYALAKAMERSEHARRAAQARWSRRDA
jgi:hypothetical protein